MNKIEFLAYNQRHLFDPANKADRKAAKYFFETHSWEKGICPFHLEWPYLNVPDMIRDRVTKHALK